MFQISNHVFSTDHSLGHQISDSLPLSIENDYQFTIKYRLKLRLVASKYKVYCALLEI